MIRWLLLIVGLIGLSLSPLRAEEPPTYYFEFEVDETRLIDRIDEDFDYDVAMEASLDIARKRIGGGDFELKRIGNRRIALTLTHKDAPLAARDVFGISGQLDFLLVVENAKQADLAKGLSPEGTVILKSKGTSEVLALRQEGGISGERLTMAQPAIQPETGQSVVNLQFDETGGEQLAVLTSANVGKRMAIVLDGAILSAPTINEPILGGTMQISGRFTQESANQLAVALASGALPTPFRLVEERLISKK